MGWVYGVAFTYFVLILAIAGCPTSNSAVDWPTERLDFDVENNKPTVASSQPAAVQVGDIDGDGFKDAVSVWRGSSDISSTLGTVAVNFQDTNHNWQTFSLDSESITHITTSSTINGVLTPTNSEIARYADANAIALADVSGDGRPDVLVASGNHITYLQSPTDPADTKDASKWAKTDIVPYQVSSRLYNPPLQCLF